VIAATSSLFDFMSIVTLDLVLALTLRRLSLGILETV
jgi:hypothetical protein